MILQAVQSTPFPIIVYDNWGRVGSGGADTSLSYITPALTPPVTASQGALSIAEPANRTMSSQWLGAPSSGIVGLGRAIYWDEGGAAATPPSWL